MPDHAGDHLAHSAHLAKRYRSERRFRLMGLAALGLAALVLVLVLGGTIQRALPALWYHAVTLPVPLTNETLAVSGPLDAEALHQARFDTAIRTALTKHFPEAAEAADIRKLRGLVSRGAESDMRNFLKNNPSQFGTSLPHSLRLSDDADMFLKGRISKTTPEHLRRLSDKEIHWLESLEHRGLIARKLNTAFFTNPDSRLPELAGIAGSLAGSLWLVLVCLLSALPIAIMAALYLEEFAPKNRATDWLEVTINNLAAVPSVIYGLLGLSLYLHWMALPRSSALAGGLTLALLILPVIIIATRTALRSVPGAIRDAARALGATPMQVVMHHVLPLATPGIMTGTILGLARAIGETAPLLMIGMVAFIASVPSGITDPATAMPVQIYLWSDSPELAFAEKTSLLILVLLIILISMNSLAAYIRRKCERRW